MTGLGTSNKKEFPLIKLAKKLKDPIADHSQASGELKFPLIKLAKKLKDGFYRLCRGDWLAVSIN